MVRLTEYMVEARTKQCDMSSVKKLSCWSQDLHDVAIVRKMCNVEVLALSVNKIDTLEPFEDCKNLRELYLRDNKINSLEELQYLKNLPQLECLWLVGNPCCDTAGPNYRSMVLRVLPKLKRLDNIDVSESDLKESHAQPLPKNKDHPTEKHQRYQKQPVKRSCPGNRSNIPPSFSSCCTDLYESKQHAASSKDTTQHEMHPTASSRCNKAYEPPTASPRLADVHEEQFNSSWCNKAYESPAASPRLADVHEEQNPSSRCNKTYEPPTASPRLADIHEEQFNSSWCNKSYEPPTASPRLADIHEEQFNSSWCNKSYEPPTASPRLADVHEEQNPSSRCNKTYEPPTASPILADIHEEQFNSSRCNKAYEPPTASPRLADIHEEQHHSTSSRRTEMRESSPLREAYARAEQAKRECLRKERILRYRANIRQNVRKANILSSLKLLMGELDLSDLYVLQEAISYRKEELEE